MIRILTATAVSGLQESSLREPEKPKITELVKSWWESGLAAAPKCKHIYTPGMFCCNSKQTERGCVLALCKAVSPTKSSHVLDFFHQYIGSQQKLLKGKQSLTN